MFFWDKLLFEHIGEFDFLIRLFVACLCGGLIGFERTKRQKEAGIRTHLIVALGSALLMVISKYAFYDLEISAVVSADASRIASNVVTGVSFLGAGVIFVRGASIKGLTTAAGIWATAAVGMAVGAGMYTLGIFVTVLMVVLQITLHKWFLHDNATCELTILVEQDDMDTLLHIKAKLNEHNIHVIGMEMKQQGDQKEFRLEIRMPNQNVTEELLALGNTYRQIKSINT